MAINPLQAQGYGSQYFKRQKLARDQFDGNAYLQANKDVADAGLDAWTHYNDMGGGDQWWRPWSTEDKALDANFGKPEEQASAQQAPAQNTGSVPPPPPPPPPAPPPPAIAPPGNAPDFKALASMSPAQMGQSYQPTGTSSLMMDSQLMEALNKFAMEGLQTPSRWDQALVKDSVGVIDDSVKRSRSEGERALMERMAQRGTLGDNSIMWDEGYSLEDRLDENERADKTRLKQIIAGDYANDRSTAAGIGLNTGNFQRQLGRDAESDAQFAAGFNRMTGRDFEDDLRARTGFNLQGGSMTEDALMARALFGMNSQNQLFQQGMQQQDFGLRDFLGRSGVDLDNRRFQEGVRQFDTMSEIEKDRFAQQMGLSRSQLDEQVRHNKQLEDFAMLDLLNQSGDAYTVDPATGRIIARPKPATDSEGNEIPAGDTVTDQSTYVQANSQAADAYGFPRNADRWWDAKRQMWWKKKGDYWSLRD